MTLADFLQGQVPDVTTLHQVDHFLTEIDGMIADALEGAGSAAG